MAGNKSKNQLKYVDYGLMFFVIFVVMFGLVMLFSTSSYVAQTQFGDPTYFVKRQAAFAVVGLIAMYGLSRVPYQLYRVFAGVIFLFAAVLNYVVIGIGETFSGSTRWLSIGGFTFQPSEISKIAAIIFTAYWIAARPRDLYTVKGVLKIMAINIAMIGPVLLSNLSTGIIIMGVVFAMLFVGSPLYKEFAGIMMVVIVVGGVFLAAASYRMTRVQVWLNPEDYEKGYQTLQGLYAIGSAGLFGKGLGQSLQKLGFLPEPENDMIFSIICEELGLFGAVCVIVMFVLMIWRLVVIANNARDLFGSMITIGIMAHLALQVILNIAVVTNSIPNTGVTLPFISYGGTSLMVTLAEMGIALNVSRGIRLEPVQSKPKVEKEIVHG